MPGKLFALNDQGTHQVNATEFPTEFQELVQLEIDQGPHLVMATGTLRAASPDFNLTIAIRLEVHGTSQPNLGAQDTTFIAPGAPVIADRESFTLMVSADIPFEGGAGATETGRTSAAPRPRAVLSARREQGAQGFAVTGIRMVAFAFDEIVATTI